MTKTRKLAIGVCAILPCLISQQSHSDAIDHKTSDFQGKFLEYSGTLDEMALPKHGDAKVSIEISGKLAADMFAYLGKSTRQTACVAENEEMRAKQDVACVFDKRAKSVKCYIGLDIARGKSIPGLIC